MGSEILWEASIHPGDDLRHWEALPKPRRGFFKIISVATRCAHQLISPFTNCSDKQKVPDVVDQNGVTASNFACWTP